MDETAECLPMLLAEGREHLQELNLAVVGIEETPGDQAAAVVIEPPADLGELAQGRRVVQVAATLAADASIPSVRAYMVLSALAGLGETLACRPAPDEVETFTGTEVVAWLVSDRTDAELAEAAAAVVEVEAAVVTEAVPDAAVDDPTGAEPSAPAVVEPSRQAPRGHGGSSTVRVDAERLDQLMHAMGELVLHRTHVEGLAAHANVSGLPQALQALTRTSHALQAMVMQVRMIPVEAVLLRFPRLVRDLSVKLSKQVELELIGKDTELDRSVVDSLSDPLVHLIRNSLDHGLETPAERLAAGKPETGRLEIAARHAGGNVVISVSDDGRGIDPTLLDGEVWPAGGGLQAVRVAIRGLDGEVTLTSELGAGTTAEIRLPLTLAIMAALIVHADGRAFAIGLDRIERTVRLSDQTVRSVAGRRMLVMSDGVMDLICGSERFGGSVDGNADFAVIIRGGSGRVAFAVSALDGQRELVTRPLPPEVAEGSALSGAAVLSDGQIALIVDCDAVAEGVA